MRNLMFNHNSHKQQSGAVLLAFMLILITGTSYLLLNRLNDYSTYARDTETQIALLEAKKALLSYAMNYPEINEKPERGPGYLPCPDQNEDGETESNCSVNAGNGTTLGRLPFKTLGLSDLRDSSGEQLWYAVSQSFKYNQPSNHILNSETTGTISVDGLSDIVAVIIAPGDPISGQDDRPGTDRSDYLEDVNANNDAATFATSAAGEFNDRVITITRQEMMAVVEQRVINEIRAALANYYSTYGAYPWMKAFSDPKADRIRLAGTHNGSSNSSNLTDSTTDFTDWDIQNGDLVINVTDGSVTNVTGVTANTLNLDGLIWGTQNDFDNNDKYIVYKKNWVTELLSGTADAASSGLTLIDPGKDFDELGILPGDIIENLSDVSGPNWAKGVIDTVTPTQITAMSLSGGTSNAFASGNSYIIRSNTGRVTGTNNSKNLVDSGKDFTVMGVQSGDLVINLTDGSMTTVSSVTSSSTLALNTLHFGEENDFDNGDYYYLPRYNSDGFSREGLLAFHEAGKHFPSTFNIDWLPASVNAGDVIMDPAFSGTQATYQTALRTFLANYAVTSLSDSIGLNNGVCQWLTAAIADCYFYFPPENINISGTVTSGTNTSVLTDSNADFVADGVKRGDIVQNFDDEYALSPPVSGTADRGGATGVATGGSNNLLLEDTSKNFINLGVLIGDAISNTTDGSAGIIASVSATNISVSSLAGGTNNVFNPGNNYTISGNAVLYDATADFSTAGVVAYQYLVYNNTTGVRATVTEVIDSKTLKAVAFDNQTNPIIFTSGNSYTVYTPGIVVVTSVPSSTVANTARATVYNPDFDVLAGPYQEYYRILTAAGVKSGTATASSSGNVLEDAGANFTTQGIIVGDIIENSTDGSFGRITAVTATTLTVSQLYGGAENDFDNGENYIVYHDYVYLRRAEWHPRFSGNMVIKSQSNKRVRDVCWGYDATCTGISASAFSGNGGEPLITIRDYGKDGVTEVGRATFTPTGSSSGSIRLANIDYYLAETDDIPDWFIKNRWHQFIYVAYSADYIPSGANDCVTSGNCLTLQVQRPAVVPYNNREALVMVAGGQLSGQDRSASALVNYFEDMNADNDSVFEKRDISDTFNDQISVIAP